MFTPQGEEMVARGDGAEHREQVSAQVRFFLEFRRIGRRRFRADGLDGRDAPLPERDGLVHVGDLGGRDLDVFGINRSELEGLIRPRRQVLFGQVEEPAEKLFRHVLYPRA